METTLLKDPPLIQWLFQSGGGKISALTATLNWWRSRQPHVSEAKPWAWFRAMSTLGYLELDWTSDRWRCGLPTLTPLPAGDGAFFLTGARSPALIGTIADLDYLYPEIEAQADIASLPLPSSLLLFGGPTDQPHHLAARLKSDRGDIHFSGCAAFAIARLLPDLDSELSQVPGPRFGLSIERFGAAERAPTVDPRWRWHAGPRTPGLYRWDDPMRTYAWFDGDWWKVQREQGRYLALRAMGRSVLSWRPRGASGRLLVGLEGPLPPMHERALVLASGRLPTRGSSGLAFDGVPLELAKLVSASLQQELETSSDR